MPTGIFLGAHIETASLPCNSNLDSVVVTRGYDEPKTFILEEYWVVIGARLDDPSTGPQITSGAVNSGQPDTFINEIGAAHVRSIIDNDSGHYIDEAQDGSHHPKTYVSSAY